MPIERDDEGFCIDASLLGEVFGIPPHDVHALMRNRRITSRCERAEGEHAGRYRLTFFYRNRRVRLVVDEDGHVLKRSSINFGEPPPARSRAGG